MIDIGMTVNGHKIRPGIALASIEWKSISGRIGFEKVGFLSKKILGAMSGEKIFFSKNCEIVLFDEFKVEPNIDGSTMALGSGAYIENAQWGTTAYVSFIKEKLFKLVAQVVWHWEPAHKFIEECKGYIEIIYEKMTPDYEDVNQDYDDKFKIIYSDAQSELRLSYNGASGHGTLMLTCNPHYL